MQRAKLSDVARLAGVSQATASRALSGLDSVDPALAERVHDASLKLGYRKNSLARGLRRKENNVVGVVVPDVTNPFFTDLVRGVEDVVGDSDILLMLCNSDESVEKESRYLRLLVDQQVAGVVIAPVREAGEGLSQMLLGTPAVSVDRRVDGGLLDSVTLDNVAAARAIVDHLLESTHEIAAISGPVSSTTGRERQQGFQEALYAANVRPRPEWIIESDFSVLGGYRAGLKLLAGDPRPSAIFSANNLMTIGCLQAFEEYGVEPTEIHLASFGRLGQWTGAARISALSLPSYEMGRRAARILLDRIGGVSSEVLDVRLAHGDVITWSGVVANAS